MCSTPVRMPVCPLRTCVLICAEPSMHVQHAVLYALACQPVCHKLYQVLHKGLVFWCAGSNWLAGLALSVAVNLHTRTIARPHIWKVSYCLTSAPFAAQAMAEASDPCPCASAWDCSVMRLHCAAVSHDSTFQCIEDVQDKPGCAVQENRSHGLC